MARKKNAVGLDIGSSSIKVVQLKEGSAGLELQNFDIVPLPEEAVVDGSLMNFTAVVDKIKEIWKTHKIRNREVALGVSGHSVIIKKISLPQMSRDELAEQIQWEAEQYIPFDIKDVNVDVQVLNEETAQGQMDVLLVAAKKDVINDYTSVTVEAGLKPVVVDVDTFCIQNMFELSHGFPPNETVALINVGATVMNINVISDGVTSFTRDITMGSMSLTQEIQKQLGVSFEEAEHYKTGGDGELSNSSLLQEVAQMSERVSESLVTEIQRSIDFFAATSVNADISKVYLTGGGSQMVTLVNSLERRLEVPVQVVNPFKGISVDEKKFDVKWLNKMAPTAAVAVGLGLRRRNDA